MKRPDISLVLVTLVCSILLIFMSFKALTLNEEVERLQQENRSLTDEVWSMNQYLMEEETD